MLSLFLGSLFVNPLAVVELVGVYFLGFKVWEGLDAHPKMFHLDTKHLLIWSLVIVSPLLFFVFSPMMFVLAFTGGSSFAIVVTLIQFALFVTGIIQIVNFAFQLFGEKKKAR